MKSLDKQFKELIKNIEKSINKEIEKETIKIRTQNQAFILDEESENLLSDILQNDKNFPEVLRKKFFKPDGTCISSYEDQKLRSLIHELIINGLISLQWGDNIPIFGRIEQKGRSYFEMKEKYLQQYNQGESMQFKLLDKESENVLKELLANKEFCNSPCFIIPNNYSPTVIENLINLGYLYSKKGVEYFTDGGYVCGARLTQAAKTYDEMKVLNEKKFNNSITNNNYFAPIGNFQGATINNSQIQIGTENSTQTFEYTYENVNKLIKEIENKIEYEKLSQKQIEELKDLIQDIKDKNEAKKPNLVKRAFKSLWDFTKEIGCAVLSSYIAFKCGFCV